MIPFLKADTLWHSRRVTVGARAAVSEQEYNLLPDGTMETDYAREARAAAITCPNDIPPSFGGMR